MAEMISRTYAIVANEDAVHYPMQASSYRCEKPPANMG